MSNCKSFLVMNSSVYACAKHGAHTHLHSTDPTHKATSLGWGNKAPGVVHCPAGSRYVATRGTSEGNGFSFMGIRDMIHTDEWATGPYEYENENSFNDLKVEAAEMQKDWEGKIKLLEAEAINTEKAFVEIQLAKQMIKLRPSEYTLLFEQDIVESDFDVNNRSMITYTMPDVAVYNDQTATDLHEEFTKRIAYRLEELNNQAAEELLEA